MRGLLYQKSIPRYLMLKAFASRFKGLSTSALSPLSLTDVPEPELPTEQWVRIKPRLAGICGSDLATMLAKSSPYLAPITSLPFVLGHEVVGTVIESGGAVSGFKNGDRVVVQPALGCRVRGIEPLCDACAGGQNALCRNVTRGDISAGIQTGYCRDTGGAFSDQFVAHQSQLYHVPQTMEDRLAVLVEPFSCALHGVLRAPIREDHTILVLGCGAIGLLTILAIRALYPKVRIVASAKYDHQRSLASDFGANVLLRSGGSLAQRYVHWARELDAEVLDPELGKPTVIGGADVTLDCIASTSSIDDGLRFTRSAGQYVLVGMPGAPPKVDWTPMWFKELNVTCAYAYGREAAREATPDTFEIALAMMDKIQEKLVRLLSTPFELGDYRSAFAAAMNSGSTGVAKTIFAIHA